MKLKPKKAAGLDRIPQKLVKDSAVIITPFLNHVFNISLSEIGIYISLISKSGSQDECDNYRPISILSSISKIFEKIVLDQLSQYLTTNEILTDFRKGYFYLFFLTNNN